MNFDEIRFELFIRGFKAAGISPADILRSALLEFQPQTRADLLREMAYCGVYLDAPALSASDAQATRTTSVFETTNLGNGFAHAI